MLHFYTAGESHGQALLAFLSGLPAGKPVASDGINRELHRRQLGYGRGGRQKIEKDKADIFAGVRHGQTIGAPIALRIENRDWANWEKILAVEAYPEDDSTAKKLLAPRPGHADLAGSQKFDFHDARYILERASAAKPRPALLRRARQDLVAIPAPKRQPHHQVGHTRMIERPFGRKSNHFNDMESPLRCVDSAAQTNESRSGRRAESGRHRRRHF
jgi:chorismate synthase